MKQKNDFIQIIILIFALIVRQSKSSRCVVSKWRQWGECQGDCEFALRVRNRDVIKPPFPEKDEKTLQMFLRECPPLYQVEQCQPRECVDESPFNRIPTDSTQNKTKISNKEDNHQISPTQQNLRGDKIKENPNLEDPFNHIKEERKNKSLELIGILKDEGPFSTKIDLINNNKKQLKINKIDCKLPNPACCRSIRQKCTNGRKPAQLTRWYRKKGEQFCRPYKYPFCEDSTERTFAAESECIDLCFTEQEKTVLPDFRVIR